MHLIGGEEFASERTRLMLRGSILFFGPGSIPEWDGYNFTTPALCSVPLVQLLGKYRKVSIDVVCVVLSLPFSCRVFSVIEVFCMLFSIVSMSFPFCIDAH